MPSPPHKPFEGLDFPIGVHPSQPAAMAWPAISVEIFTAIPVACAVSRLSDGMLLAINDEWCALTGVAHADALGNTSTQLGIWRDEKHRQEFLSNRADTNRIYTACASGESTRKVRIRCREVHSDGVDMLIVCLIEATEEVAVRDDLSQALNDLSSANLELRARVELHLEIERLAQVGAWTNEAGKSKLTWSEGLYAITGVPRGTALTRDSARAHIHPDDFAAWLSAREAMNGRPIEFRWLTPGGHTRWLRSRMSRSKVPGNPETDFGAVQDISIERETQQKLLKQLELLNDIALRVPGLMYQAFRRPDGRTEITFMSEPIVQMLELDAHEQKSDARVIFSRVHPDDQTRLLEDFDQCAQRQLDLRNSYRVRLPSGAERWFRFEASSRHQPDGSVLWHGYIADVTDERIARLALERQQQLLRAVSSALSQYIVSGNKSEVFSGLLQSFREVVGPASLVLAEVTVANRPSAGISTLDGVFLGGSDTFKAFTLTDAELNKRLRDGEAVVVTPLHSHHNALCQGTPSSDPVVLLPLLAHLELVGLLAVQQADPNRVVRELEFLEPLMRVAAQLLLAWRIHRERSSTLKRLAETTEQLSTQRRALQVVLDSMGQGLAKLDNDGGISFYNSRLLELLNVPESLMASRPTHTQISEFLAQRGDFGADYELVDGIGRDYVQSAGDTDAPDVYLRKTREGLYLEIGTRVLPEGGCVRTITDVTQYLLTQRELANERQRLAWILEATRPGTWENDLETEQLTINDRWAELVGYTLEELSPVTNATWERLVHPDDLVKSDALRDAHLAGRAKFYECDVRMRHKEGHWVWINTRGRVHRRNSDGQPLYMSGTHIDISERVSAQEALNAFNEQLECRIAERTGSLERTLRDMEAIAYSIAHDLRTPLRSVNGFAEVLLESDLENLSAIGKRSLERIVGSSARMGQMLTEMLDVLSVVRAEISEDVVDMQALARDIDQQLGLRSSGVNLVVDPMPNALGDEKLIKQALRNLMDNAAKYARDREPPLVHVGYNAPKGAYFVRDNGIGFDMAHAEKLFGLFQRLHSDANIPGSGIGLAITSRIIERHGGRIWADAIPNLGATFWISLPMETGGAERANLNDSPSTP